ncbi:MAG: hypothetical protein ACFHWX_18215 [Bacteroidota bacterium]
MNFLNKIKHIGLLQSFSITIAIVAVVTLILGYYNHKYILYTAFNGDTYFLKRHQGSKISIFFDEGYSAQTLANISDVLDSAIEVYGSLLNNSKKDQEQITVAVVNSTCGSGCGELGGNAIEITKLKFNKFYNEVNKSNSYDQLPFYELGRVFWVFGDQLNYPGAEINHSLHTGFAVFMRFVVMENLNLKCSPFNGYSFDEQMASNRELIKIYQSDSSYTFNNSLLVGKGIPNKYGLEASNLFASILFDLYDTYGGDEFLKKLWSEVNKRPRTNSIQDIVDNFFIACSLASNQDLTDKFLNDLKWPVSKKYHYAYKKGFLLTHHKVLPN